ncbi:shikimate dehydrogenase [Amycolatopsis jiangsuensis]|uniref:Shikimate dehydrogenase n=1 Tax=Amycolatopsis jiangsuensis TaxID=1181879 RepID=A0A840IUL5_9PSEU|nr:shikimate dehydrogenase [Amycolatopsis jiangsuensis]MBB4684674.1 shikimate dehydrogenase [Amycolatopsis jiangsuensis]
MASTDGPRHAGVLGKPVAHSLSPVLHRAAFAALGLDRWTYERFETDADELPGFVDGLGPEWVGLSVTMPGKRRALDHASEVTPRAAAVGAANTLVREGDGWLADCTDVEGVTGALRVAGGYAPAPGDHAVVLGAGGTAAAAVVGLVELGVGSAQLVVRDPARAAETLAAAERAGLPVDVLTWSEADFARLADSAAVLISTVPPEAVRPHVAELAGVGSVLDVIYHPWPTPLAEAVTARGGRLATGLDMLLHQAFGQAEHFTGRPAPRAEMRAALRAATNDVLPLPIS